MQWGRRVQVQVRYSLAVTKHLLNQEYVLGHNWKVIMCFDELFSGFLGESFDIV